METVTKNAEETQKLGEEFASKVKNGGVLCLYGDLGSGKTTFVQGLAKGLGIRRRIISPTFVIVRTYGFKIYDLGFKNFYHIDLYRVQTEHDLEGIGIKEIMSDPSNIVVIEWPEKLGSLLPEKRRDIKFSYEGEGTRKVIFERTPCSIG